MLRGEEVNASGKHVRLSKVRLDHPPTQTPPVSLGVRGPKSLYLSGTKADGTILAECAAPEYVSWARGHIAKGASDAGRLPEEHRVTVYALCAVNNDPDKARQAIRPIVAKVLASGRARVQIEPLGIAEEVVAMVERGGAGLLAEEVPDGWLDKLAVVGSPEDCALAISRLAEAGASSVVLQPPYDRLDEAWLDEISRELLPRLGSVKGT
jgi:alkanesulfonate monooxygenase SsuD/methylene tetrahydromethanopterin reductase-like flavin-dependent oxidoreductase (luciferase family)